MQEFELPHKYYIVIIAGIFVLAILVRAICFVGLIGSDDLAYNRATYALSEGKSVAELEKHFRNRIGLFLPGAFIFRHFGVNESSSAIFPFFCFLLTLSVLIYITAKYFGKWASILAGLLYTFHPLEIFHASMLLTDLPAAAFIALSGSLIFYGDRVSQPSLFPNTSSNRIKAYIAMFLGGMMLGYAYMIKEFAVFFGIFISGYFVYRVLAHKTRKRPWLWFWIGLFTIIGIECGYYYWKLGNPFYRYSAIQSTISWDGAEEFTRRYFYGMSLSEYLLLDRFRVVFNLFDFSFYFFFIFAGIIYGISKRLKQLYYFIGWFLVLFLLISFSSISLSQYMPLRSVPRYFLLLSVPGIIIMTSFFQEIRHILEVDDSDKLKSFQISLWLPWGVMFVINLQWFSLIQLLFLIFIVILSLCIALKKWRAWLRSQIPQRYLSVIIPLVFLYINLLPGVYMAAKGERPRKGITCERDIRPSLEFPLTHTIYTDSRTEDILEYLYEYQYDDQIQAFGEAQMICSDTENWRNAYVIANWERLFFLNRVYHTPIPQFLFHPCPTWKPVAKLGDDVNPCLIYEVP